MMVHEDKGMDFNAESFGKFGNQMKETAPVVIGERVDPGVDRGGPHDTTLQQLACARAVTRRRSSRLSSHAQCIHKLTVMCATAPGRGVHADSGRVFKGAWQV